jgi:hypothetical protein
MVELSKFERELIEIMVELDPEREILLQQLADATVRSRDFTGVGVYVEIQVPDGLPKIMTTSRYIEQTPKAHFTHPNLTDGGGALLWFDSGTMCMLECYSYDGDWPSDESLFNIDRDA